MNEATVRIRTFDTIFLRWLAKLSGVSCVSPHTMEGSDPASEAMDRYAEGDDDAFAEVYDLVAPRLFGFLLRQTRDRAAAEDLVQQTLMQMSCNREAYMTGVDVMPWAFAIARRLSIDAFRRRRNVVGDAAFDVASEDTGPDDALRRKQAAEALQATLDGLPEAQRAAFELVKYDGMSLAQAAETLGTTVAAVKLRAHRTYAALRGALHGDRARER